MKKVSAQELKDTSVVMTKFDIGEGMQGLIGVVGPTRMDYATIVPRAQYIMNKTTDFLAEGGITNG